MRGAASRNAAHERGQEVGAQRLVAADDEAPYLVGLEPHDALLGAVEEGEDLRGVVEQLLPGAGELHALAAAEEERRAELPPRGSSPRPSSVGWLTLSARAAAVRLPCSRDGLEVSELSEVQARLSTIVRALCQQ